MIAPSACGTPADHVTAISSGQGATFPATGNSGLGEGFYPRLVQVQGARRRDPNLLATFQRGGSGLIFESKDGGNSFTPRASIDAANGPNTKLCCTALFALPTRLGHLRRGTLLWAGSMTLQQDPLQMRLGIWRSQDGGRTWIDHGSCATGAGGLWEPQLLVTANRSLVCLYSDETQQPTHSQVINETISHDGGFTFGPPRAVVVLDSNVLRPGMPTVARLPDGTWRMTYEVCNSSPHCQVRMKNSGDGIDWGDPRAQGDWVVAADGSYFTHTPVLSWSRYGGREGTLILSGQIYNDATGAPSMRNGRTLLINRSGGKGAWLPIDAPVAVASPVDDYCQNYSSPVLALGGRKILEFATAWDGSTCTVRFARGLLPAVHDP